MPMTVLRRRGFLAQTPNHVQLASSYMHSCTKPRTTRGLRMHNCRGIATRSAITSVPVQRDTDAGCGYAVYISTNN